MPVIKDVSQGERSCLSSKIFWSFTVHHALERSIDLARLEGPA